MHAVVRADDASTSLLATAMPGPSGRPFSWSESFRAPETASEVDAAIGVARRAGRLTWMYGVRYLNYQARLNASGLLADRNTLVLPFAGVERALGN